MMFYSYSFSNEFNLDSNNFRKEKKQHGGGGGKGKWDDLADGSLDDEE